MIKQYTLMTRIAFCLTLVLMLSAQWSNARFSGSKNATVANTLPWADAQKAGIKAEILSKRNRHSKTFETDHGTQKLYTAPGSIHYQEGGIWKEINNQIQPNNGTVHAGHPYYNGFNAFKTYYPQQLHVTPLYTSLAGGEIGEVLESVYAVDQSGNTVYQFPLNGAAIASAADSKVQYINAFPNMTVQYTQQNDGRKFDVVLQSPASLSVLPSSAKYIVIKEKMILPASWTITSSDNGYDLFAGSTRLANFPRPVAMETESASKIYETDADFMSNGLISMVQTGNEVIITTKFDVNWLSHSSRSYPLYLDPVVSYFPDAVSMATGNMTGPTAAKTSGNVRLAGAGTLAWATFNITALPAGATIITATYFGNHFNGTNAIPKIATIVGMETVNPITATNTQINAQTGTTGVGPVYNSNYTFGALTIPTWYSGPLTGNATSDIAAQQSQGWTALGIRYTSGSTGTMIQQPYTNVNMPYLELDFSTSACAGTPVAGTATSTLALACGDPFVLNLSGNSTGSGLSYQWQSSPQGAGTWTNLGSPQASPNYTVTQSAPSDYRCFLVCSNSGLSDTSTVVSVGQNTVLNCYCAATGNVTSVNYITNFTTTGAIVNIANPATTYSTNGYGDYTNLIASANPGTSVNFSVAFVAGSQLFGLWIDWNQDGDFNDAGETIVQTTSASTSPLSGVINVPITAIPGNTRMRIRNSNSGAAVACGFSASGEAEDYTFNVLGPCSSAGAGSITPSSYNVCPLTTQAMTATVPTFQLGTTYQWKVGSTSGGPYTNVTGGTGATGLTYTTAALTPGTYYYILETTCANCGPCSALSNEVVITVPFIDPPIGTNSAQCAPGVPTASVVSGAGASGSGNFNWYSAATGGTLLQARPYGPVAPYYFNDFSSAVLPSNSSIYSSASVTGGGLQLHPATISQYGAFMVDGSGYQSDKYEVEFDFSTVGTPATMAEGFSYSFGAPATVLPTAEASMNAENGTGSNLKLCFVAATSGVNTQGIYLFYGNTTNEANPSATLGGGGAGYSNNTTWENTSGNNVKLTIDSLGKVSVVLNGVTIFNNLQLPLGYMNANRATWRHVWKGRTTANTMLTTLDNISIKQSTLVSGSPTYLSSVSTTTTFYVAEEGLGGCYSTRTPVTVTVNTPPVLTITPTPNDTVCTGAPVTLSGSGAITYLWNGNTTLVNGDTTFNATAPGIYTITGTDANSCSNTATISISLLPVLNGSASASPSTVCSGGSTQISASVIPVCTGNIITGFRDYYTPGSWTTSIVSSNGFIDSSAAPANVKINSGAGGPPVGGFIKYSKVITCTGTLSFNWSFFHPTDAYEDVPQYAVNSGFPVDLPGYNQFGFNGTQNGVFSLPVIDGDTVHIIVTNFSNDPFAGLLTMTNFSAPDGKLTGSISIWDAPNGGTNLGTAPLTVNPTGSGTVTYYAQYTVQSTGCVNLMRDPINVTVNTAPTATVTGGGAVCTGSPLPDVTITLTGTGPWDLIYTDGSATYTVTAIASSPYIIPNAPVGTYSVSTVTDAICNASGTGSVTVSVSAPPTATVTGGGAVCTGVALPDVSFDLTGTSPWTLVYSDGTNTNTVTAIASSPYVISNAAAGTYTVVSISDAVCAGAGSGSVSVSVDPLPVVTATISPSTVCYANSAIANGGGAVSYVWDNGITDNQAFVATATTTYMVTGTDANGCTNTATALLTVNTQSTNLSLASAGNTSSNTGNENDSNTQPDGTTVMYSDPSCNLIASVQDIAGGNSLGTTTAMVTVEPTVLTYPAVGGQPYTRRWYMITPTNNTGVNAVVVIYQTQDDFDDYNAANGAFPDLPTGPADIAGIANVMITKVSGGPLGVGTAGTITPTSVVWNATTGYWEITFNVTGNFSSFFVHGVNPLGSALPANVISFTGQKTGSTDLLKWTTSYEQNNASFDLQHSTDGIQFVTIANIKTKANGGNSVTKLEYEAVHSNPAIGRNYYRLEQIDINGHRSIDTRVVELLRTADGQLVDIYPNPAKDVLYVDVYGAKAGKINIQLRDLTGRMIKQIAATSTEGLNRYMVSMNELSPAFYMVQVYENGKQTMVHQIRKD